MKSGPIDEIGAAKSSTPKTGMNKGVAILDFILRILAFVGTLGSAILMGTTNQTLPFFTQFVQFRARFQDLPSFTFFVLGNAIVSGYLIVSLGFSIFHIIRSHAQKSKVVLVFLDAAMLVLLTSAASAAAAIVYLAHKGNSKANWLSICQQFNSFCERSSGSLIGSYVGVVTFVILIMLSGFSLSRR